jgi:hypothetical protein
MSTGCTSQCTPVLVEGILKPNPNCERCTCGDISYTVADCYDFAATEQGCVEETQKSEGFVSKFCGGENPRSRDAFLELFPASQNVYEQRTYHLNAGGNSVGQSFRLCVDSEKVQIKPPDDVTIPDFDDPKVRVSISPYDLENEKSTGVSTCHWIVEKSNNLKIALEVITLPLLMFIVACHIGKLTESKLRGTCFGQVVVCLNTILFSNYCTKNIVKLCCMLPFIIGMWTFAGWASCWASFSDDTIIHKLDEDGKVDLLTKTGLEACEVTYSVGALLLLFECSACSDNPLSCSSKPQVALGSFSQY